jgi:sugar phosphate isomerase/epimerase
MKTNAFTATDYIKLGVAALGLTGIAFFGWKIYKKASDKAADRREGRDLKNELNKNNLTLSEGDFNQIASTIETALNQSDDDEKTVYRQLEKLKTKDDWLKLQIVFGSRKRDNNWPYSDMTGGLTDWLTDAFNSYEIGKVNNILSKIGVTI